jgi:hypothetical protein
MNSVVQMRLDPEAQRTLDMLVRRLEWSPSRVVRESLLLMGRYHSASPRKRVIGVGKFRSGLPDLGSNKRHMQGFGQ